MSPAVGPETIQRFMPRQNPQWRRVGVAPEVDGDVSVICSITIAVKGRAPVFASLAAAVVDVPRRHAAATGVSRLRMCVMPDHVQLILGMSPTGAIVTFAGTGQEPGAV